jgi:hypothetical protein
MKSSLEVSDEQSAAVQKTPNRVTLETLEASIERVEYIRPEMAPQFTLAIVKMKNGYIVTGESAPADPANFNEALGQKFAYEAAVRKIWPLMGFALCEKLANGGLTE